MRKLILALAIATGGTLFYLNQNSQIAPVISSPESLRAPLQAMLKDRKLLL